MSESDVEQAVAPLYKTFTNPGTTILSNPGHVELHLTAEGASAEEAEARIEELARGMRERLPGRIYSEDGRDLPTVVGALLRERKLTLALAESCTGGLVAARLTEPAGASEFLARGWRRRWSACAGKSPACAGSRRRRSISPCASWVPRRRSPSIASRPAWSGRRGRAPPPRPGSRALASSHLTARPASYGPVWSCLLP